jgi:mannose-6-phosphate isomerase-like protein (cupin superfamily)
MIVQNPLLRILMAATVLLAAPAALQAADDQITVKQLDAIVKDNPLGGATAAIVDSVRAGGAEIGVLIMSKNRLHHHEAQDHVLFVVRGTGIAKLENTAGQVETRTVKPGDILGLPRGKKHGFEKSGDQDLVFLVVATPLPPGVEETTYHE